MSVGDNEKMVREIDELRYAQQVYQNQYLLINNTINAHLQDVQALGAAQHALENVNMISNREVLTQMGANVFVKANVNDAKSVLVGVGGGYVVEKGIDDAKGYVGALIARKTDAINNLSKSKRELQDALIDISYRIDAASGQV